MCVYLFNYEINSLGQKERILLLPPKRARDRLISREVRHVQGVCHIPCEHVDMKSIVSHVASSHALVLRVVIIQY